MNDFQAIILAAGRGKRLKSLTENIPKCLIKINDNTILDRQVEILFRNGINEIIIVTGYRYQLIKNHINNKNIKIIVNDKFTELDALYSTWLAKKYIKSDFLLLYGDLVFDEKTYRPVAPEWFNLLSKGKIFFSIQSIKFSMFLEFFGNFASFKTFGSRL